MLGTGLQFGRGEDRFYNPVKARRNQNKNLHADGFHSQKYYHEQKPRNYGSDADVVVAAAASDKSQETDNFKSSALNNLDRFLESTTPSVAAHYLSTKRMRSCDVEYHPYFSLHDLWESFKEWSAYGAGVPFILNHSDSVVQYYVPYLSAIQIYGYGDTLNTSTNLRRPGEDSDSDYYRDSSSDGSSDGELERNFREHWTASYLNRELPVRMDRLSLRDNPVAAQEGFSSDDGEAGNSRDCLLFEFLEQDPPYSREPLADKASCFLSYNVVYLIKRLDLLCSHWTYSRQISVLARRFPALKMLRSCDLLSASWMSVAWYPIYRIPTGPTLKDLDACFLTFHSLSTPMKGAGIASSPFVTYPDGIDGVSKISLPVFGLASYKFKGPMWVPSGGCERLSSTNSLLQEADNWLRLRQVSHPDFKFFVSNGACRR
ncbi:hypothetical protein Syun_022238 [Stephania yunnanensis]|uniref:Uncharacterized protein n=1 Tax=Stephania yunnanensis TaxID=152371 RepID=A0AAP0IIK6_9MAGN